jgi:Ca2+:H+ antiporter
MQHLETLSNLSSQLLVIKTTYSYFEALKENLFSVVKASLLGSILSNLLLVLGFSFLFGGIKYPKQTFGVTAAQTSSGILMFSVLTIAIPAVFVNTIPGFKTCD